MKRLKVCLVGLMPFPFGGAPSSRLRSLALGLKEAGAKVYVLAYASDYLPKSTSLEHPLSFKGISCFVFNDLSISDKNKQGSHFRQIVRQITGQRLRQREMDAILSKIQDLFKSGSLDIIIFYNQEPGYALKLIKLCRQNEVTYVQLYNELHIPDDYRVKIFNPIWIREQIHIRIIPSRSDGNIVISSLLLEKCRRAGAQSTLVVPALTNTELLANVLPTLKQSKPRMIFTYLGKGSRRDSIEIMLQAAARVHRLNLPFKLQLYGLSTPNIIACEKLVESYDLSQVVDVYGWVNDAKLADIFSETDVFILLKTYDQSSIACFPTRLPEYLHYGKPVIISSLGDPYKYFMDMSNAIITIPEDVFSIEQKMIYLINNQSKAQKIGLAGQDLNQTAFNYSLWGKMILEYLGRL